jgi:phospholipase C
MALSGSTTIVANSTQTYVATAIGPGGTVTQSVTVTVTAPFPTFTTLTATPTSITAGQNSTLQWATLNSQYVTINGISQQFQPSDQMSVAPTTTTTYTATATGPGGAATQTVTVSVNPVSITLNAAPTTIKPGDSSTLTWSSVGATSVTINGVNGTQNPNGSVAVTPAQTTTYTATASDGNGNTATSATTVTVFAPSGSLAGIKHIIFMMQENRSFDNYFGKLGAYRAAKVGGASPSDVNDLDQLPAALANGIKTRTDAPHPSMLIPPFHERTLQTEDLSPSWNESHYDAHLVGMNYMNVASSSTFKMDYFLQTTHSVSPDLYDPDGTRPMGYYDSTDLPYYYELATQFAISDNFHSSLLSQTNPNRMYLFAATSLGHCNADPTGHAPWQTKTIFDELLAAGVSWRYYYQDGVFLAQFADWSNPRIQGNVYNITNLFTVLSQPTADQQLPAVIFIERGKSTDEHPDNNIQAGATVVKSVLDALMASSAWKDSIFIFTYDEGGGVFDHVPPYMVTPPGDMDPNCPTLTQGLYNLSGFRVPMVAISPYSKPHYVSHTPMENTSILKLIETRFNLPALTQRDASAPDMTEFFDFSNPYWFTPPPMPAQPNECLTNRSRCSQKLETYPNLP